MAFSRAALMLAAALPALVAARATAQSATTVTAQAPSPAATPPATEAITVVGSSPLIGGGVDRALIPAETQVLGTAEINRNGAPDALQALNTDVAGVTLDSASGNPYQPSLFYNGFETSPLQGTSQGIAVYMNGVRFNQPFGDTVNWDLVPDVAIARLNVEGSNPVFGLNALGGAINVRLKDGFSSPGGEAEVSGGSFGQVQGNLQYGTQSGDQAFYGAASIRHEDGWRNLQSSDIQNLYGDWGVRHDGAEIHVTLTAANSSLNGPGTAPVQLLAADPAAQFTAPNLIDNRFLQAAVNATIPLTDVWSLQALGYYDYFQQRVFNGNTANDAPCDNGTGLLCSSPGVPSTTRGGGLIPDFLNGGPYSELDRQTTNTNGYGGGLQATDTGDFFGLHNHLVAGLAFDGAQTEFGATAFLGGLSPITRIFTTPSVVLDEPGVNVPVRVAISDADAGAYASDTLNLTQALALTVSGRFTFSEVDLRDQGGGDLTGNHAYARFNPAAGITYRLTPWLAAYAGYAEANRAPTPSELSCAGPQNSCSLANFFVGDPDLKQVIAHTVEAGLRGRTPLGNIIGFGPTRLGYDLGLFHTDSDDDIAFINSPRLNRAYFANVGQTRREGFSARTDLKAERYSAYIAYTYTQATFQNGFTESAGSNPLGDANGNVTIRPGDSLPGIPRTTIKAGLDTDIGTSWHVGADAEYQSGEFLFGDEANLNPRLPGFFTLDLHGSYDITDRIQLFANIENALNERYYTYGTFSPTSSVYLSQAPGAANPRSYSLAAPIGAFGGVKVKF